MIFPGHRRVPDLDCFTNIWECLLTTNYAGSSAVIMIEILKSGFASHDQLSAALGASHDRHRNHHHPDSRSRSSHHAIDAGKRDKEQRSHLDSILRFGFPRDRVPPLLTLVGNQRRALYANTAIPAPMPPAMAGVNMYTGISMSITSPKGCLMLSNQTAMAS